MRAYLLQVNPHPLVALVAHVKVARAVPDVPDLLVLVQMLVEEGLDLGLVHVTHLFRGHGDLVPVLIPPLRSELVDALELGDSLVDDTQLGERLDVDGRARVVREALVALLVWRGLLVHGLDGLDSMMWEGVAYGNENMSGVRLRGGCRRGRPSFLDNSM